MSEEQRQLMRELVELNLEMQKILLVVTEAKTIDPKVLGQRIRQLRQSKAKSQGELGYCLGRTHAAVSDIELGKTNLTVQDLTKIAAFLGVTVNDILEQPEPVATKSYVHYRDAKGITPEQKQTAANPTQPSEEVEQIRKDGE